MHTLQRLVVLFVLLVALVPLSTFALVDPGQRHEAATRLGEAIERAVGQYRSNRSAGEVDEERVEEAQAKVDELDFEKNEVKSEIESYEEPIRLLKEQYGIDVYEKKWGEFFSLQERECFFCIARDRFLDSTAPRGLGEMLAASFGVLHGAGLGGRLMRDREMHLLTLIADAKGNLEALTPLKEKLAMVENEHSRAEQELEYAKSGTVIGGPSAQLSEREEEIRRVMEEVHAQVMRMQSDLARIDARLRAQAERKLIEKGLMEPKPGEHSQGIVPYTPQFVWPAYGSISAGFMDPNYRKAFGIPHRGMDIVIAQGSPIASAADGVVFLTKNGGPKGYSYILIGHRGGYATLYGHLTHISVYAGQDVRAGEIIGASGGQPGTHGAGPTTTGPHLHFEVIQGGVNLDPRSVLP